MQVGVQSCTNLVIEFLSVAKLVIRIVWYDIVNWFEFIRQYSLNMLFANPEVRTGKKCARGLEYGPRPQAKGCTQDRGHSFSQYRST